MTLQTNDPAQGADAAITTDVDAREAIEALTRANYALLAGMARKFVRRRLRRAVGTAVEADDLVGLAVKQTLAGERPWRGKVPMVIHLIGAMRSESSNMVKKAKNRGLRQMPEEHDCADQRQVEPGDRMAVLDDFNALLDIFADDDEAQQLLRLQTMELTASEIQQRLGIEKHEHDTIRKRIRRRIVQRRGEDA